MWLTLILVVALCVLLYVVRVISREHPPDGVLSNLVWMLFYSSKDISTDLLKLIDQSTHNANGKTVLITGGTSGLGKALSRYFAELSGCSVYVTVLPNSPDKPYSHPNIHPLPLDLTQVDSIKEFLKVLISKGLKIDIFISNAGIVRHKLFTTQEGFESCFAVNYLGPFILTNKLLEHNLLNFSQHKPRIIFISSDSHQASPQLNLSTLGQPLPFSLTQALQIYGQTKFLLISFFSEFTRRYHGKVDTFAICPGPFFSKIGSENTPPVVGDIILALRKWMNPTAQQAALPVLALALRDGIVGVDKKGGDLESPQVASGSYFSQLRLKSPNPLATNPTFASHLWSKTLLLLNPHIQFN